jgi:hypothetical protein
VDRRERSEFELIHMPEVSRMVPTQTNRRTDELELTNFTIASPYLYAGDPDERGEKHLYIYFG